MTNEQLVLQEILAAINGLPEQQRLAVYEAAAGIRACLETDEPTIGLYALASIGAEQAAAGG
jgi:hypothetical protein